MKVLVACEESQVVCRAFRARGHEAYSCDIQPCSGGHPEWHIQDDVTFHLNEGWDLMIAHPPCTYLCSSGLFRNNNNPERKEKTEHALRFVCDLMNAPIKLKAIENPRGCISTRIFRYVGFEGPERWEIFPRTTIGIQPSQTIHPYQFGDNASKQTCLYLQGLKRLKPTHIIQPRIVNGKRRWGNQTDDGQNKCVDDSGKWLQFNNPMTAKLRSRTYEGIANAMAEQWGSPYNIKD